MRTQSQFGMKVIAKNIIVFLALAYLIGCAKPASPTGGPRDTEPPKLLQESEPNFQTNFNKKKIVLHFDEFVQLSNPSKEILVSPPTTYLPEFKNRTNTITFEFNENEELKENTTYQINFGNAIADLNESNKLENYTFIFATGDKLDSLAFGGTVVDLLDGSPQKEMLVMVYDDLRDSVVFEKKPSYFARTDENGSFQITNMRSDTFKVFALMDANLNFLYDNKNEKIAHLDTTLLLTDSVQYNIKLKAYYERKEQAILNADGKTPGIIKCALNNKKPIPEFYLSNDSLSYESCLRSDSLIIYYNPIPQEGFYLITNEDSLSISPRLSRSNALTIINKKDQIKTHPDNPIKFEYSHCLVESIDSLINLTDTSDVAINFESRISNGLLLIEADFADTSDYLLEILPNAVKSFIQSNQDTLRANIQSLSADEYGQIIIRTDSLSIQETYIYNLLLNDLLIETRTVNGINKDSFQFMNMNPGIYNLEIIEDKNGDGIWTPGTYIGKTKAERKVVKTLDNLKKGWELNVNFDVNSLNNQ